MNNGVIVVNKDNVCFSEMVSRLLDIVNIEPSKENIDTLKNQLDKEEGVVIK